MKTFIYYLTLIVLACFMQGCTIKPATEKSDLIKLNTYFQLEGGTQIYKIVIEEHDYLYIYRNDLIIHSGSCRKCQKERNKLINKLINE